MLMSGARQIPARILEQHLCKPLCDFFSTYSPEPLELATTIRERGLPRRQLCEHSDWRGFVFEVYAKYVINEFITRSGVDFYPIERYPSVGRICGTIDAWGNTVIKNPPHFVEVDGIYKFRSDGGVVPVGLEVSLSSGDGINFYPKQRLLRRTYGIVPFIIKIHPASADIPPSVYTSFHQTFRRISVQYRDDVEPLADYFHKTSGLSKGNGRLHDTRTTLASF